MNVEGVIQKPTEYTLFKYSQKTQDRLQLDEQARVQIDKKTLPTTAFFTFFHSTDLVNDVAFSDDGSIISASCSDSSIRLFNFNEGRVVNGMNPTSRLTGHTGPVFSSSISPDHQWMVSGSEDSTVRLWSVGVSTCLMSFAVCLMPVAD